MTDVSKTLEKFVKEMKYLENEHALGAFFYGSYLTGYNDQFSDLDIQVILDDSDLENYVVGRKYVDGIKIQYQEKPIKYVYASVILEWNAQNTAAKNIFGKSKILFDKTGRLKKLQKYVIEKYSNMLPPADEGELEDNIYGLENEIENLKRVCAKNSPDFTILYYLLIDSIRKVYHKLNCISFFSPKKVYKTYLDDAYRKSLSIAKPDEKFISMYINLISDNKSSNEEKLNNIVKFYNYVKKDMKLNENEYRILLSTKKRY